MGYCIRASVDWLDILVYTLQSTNFQTVQRACNRVLGLPAGRNLHVKAINPNAGGGATTFKIRLHDIERFTALEKFRDALGREIDLAPSFNITGLELAVDFFADQNAKMAAQLFGQLQNPVSNNTRIYHSARGLTQAIPTSHEALVRHLDDGWQIGIGNKTDNHYQHIYLKNTDTQCGERQPIPPRARLENRITGNELPWQSLDAWRDAKFEKLAKWFRQRQTKPDLDPLEQIIADRHPQPGKTREVKRRDGGGMRLNNPLTQANADNEAIRNALRKLSERWKATSNRGRKPSTPHTQTCGNSGGIPALKPDD